MELIENDFTIPFGDAQHLTNSQHFQLLYDPQQQVDHLSMSYIPHTQAHHQGAPSFHQSFTPHTEPCNKMLDKIGQSGGRKRKRGNKGAEGLKTSDVIHVRAKRGQATDSHSIAERVRRKKINEKLQSLHDIVPGCHKTMGMAVMLDVVIKYIQSLQNQIEFLSMKLLSASLFHDLNSSDMEAGEIMHGSGQMADGQEAERFGTEGYAGGAHVFYSTFPHESYHHNQ